MSPLGNILSGLKVDLGLGALGGISGSLLPGDPRCTCNSCNTYGACSGSVCMTTACSSTVCTTSGCNDGSCYTTSCSGQSCTSKSCTDSACFTHVETMCGSGLAVCGVNACGTGGSEANNV